MRKSTWALIALLPLAVALAATPSAGEVEGWRTPDGALYFGAEPPAGSTRIDAVRATPTSRLRTPPTVAPAADSPTPTRTPRPTATLRPAATAKPTAPVAVTPPTAGSSSRSEGVSAAPTRAAEPSRSAIPPPRESRCAEIVAIRDTRPTLDLEEDRVTMSGEVLVNDGGPVKDLRVCFGGTCTLVAGGKILAVGETARFTVTAQSRRPTGLTVLCSVPKAP